MDVALCREPSYTSIIGMKQIKRLGWRGLWMTKNIEGMVDDSIAAKLAIGEGRQVRVLP